MTVKLYTEPIEMSVQRIGSSYRLMDLKVPSNTTDAWFHFPDEVSDHIKSVYPANGNGRVKPLLHLLYKEGCNLSKEDKGVIRSGLEDIFKVSEKQ